MNTALISLAPYADRQISNVHAESRPRADFLAQLIAIKSGMPQTRGRRRAGPEEAIAAYGALVRWPGLPGRALSRSL